MNPKAKFQLDPQQQENWEKNTSYLYFFIKLNRLLYILYFGVFGTAICAKILDLPFRICTSSFSIFLTILFTELHNHNLKKGRIPYYQPLYILGIIVTLWVPIFTIADWFVYSYSPNILLIHVLFGLLSTACSVLFLYFYRSTTLPSNPLKIIMELILLIQPVLAPFLILGDIQYCFTILPIIFTHLCEVSLILARAKVMHSLKEHLKSRIAKNRGGS